MFTAQDNSGSTREQLDGRTVEVQVAANVGGRRAIPVHPFLNEKKNSRRSAYSLNRCGRGWGADTLAGNEPPDIFRELQDEDDDGEPNANSRWFG